MQIMSRIAYFDCFSGASGDMLLGSLLDAELELDFLQQQIAKLGLSEVQLLSQKATCSAISAKQFTVQHQAQHQQRNLDAITELINAANLPETVVQNACKIFSRLAEAEARVHGIDIQKVHFHEVGAVDSIIDIVGFCIALHKLDIQTLYCSPLALGSGTITCQHGQLPAPAPATVELLKNIPVITGQNAPGELTTPTAAAILSTLAKSFGPMPGMVIRSLGYGAGTRPGRKVPNMVRVLIGSDLAASDQEADVVAVLETQIDDMTGQQLAHLCQILLADGALDVVQIPIYMKKGRPGVLLQTLARTEDIGKLENILFEHSSTFGIRSKLLSRSKLERRWITVKTQWGPVKVKLGYRSGKLIRIAPEYEDCRAAATKGDVTLMDLIDQAKHLAANQLEKGT